MKKHRGSQQSGQQTRQRRAHYPLITHPMETGLRQGPNGFLRPKRLIQSLTADVAGERVFEAEFYRAVATDPYVRFFIAPDVSGDLILTWTEDSGRSVRATAAIV